MSERSAPKLALLVLVVASFAVTACGRGSNAQEPKDAGDRSTEETTTVRLDPDDPLVQDAKMYAKDQDVPLEEAVRRLQLQESVGKLGAELEASERDTFAGLWIEHEPEYRVITAFTRDGEQTIRPYAEGGPLEDVVEVREASATLAELQEAQERAGDLVRDLGIQADFSIVVQQNRVEVEVTGRAQLETALQRANARPPGHVVIVEVEELAQPV